MKKNQMIKSKKGMAGFPISKLPTPIIIVLMILLGVVALGIFGISLYMLYKQLVG